jgi:hypothetical protein
MELQDLLIYKKTRLHQLKVDGFFGKNSVNGSQKYASHEAQRRRKEIREIENEISRRKLIDLRKNLG